MTGPPLWVADLVDEFWRQAGGPEPFPRRLREPILWSPFDLTVEEIPLLTTDRVDEALSRRGCPLRCRCRSNRALRGCLVSANGGGFIFLDAGDSNAERTFTLAHELAHFLRDYLQPRRRAVDALGPAILEVLDGRRKPTPVERLHALLRRVPVGGHLHLMHRQGDRVEPAVCEAEADADRLALELLAPGDEILRRLNGGTGFAVTHDLLRMAFGLPPDSASEYAHTLFPSEERPSLLLRLRKIAVSRRTPETSGEEEAGGWCDEYPA